MSNTPITFTSSIAVLASALLMSACSPPETSTSLVADARALQQKGDNVGALIQLKNAAVKNPADGEARLALAQAYNRVGDAASAEKEVRKAMTLGIPVARTLPELLLSQLFQARFQQVIDATSDIAYTADAQVISQRGVAFYQLKKYDEASETFERALKRDAGNPISLMGLANIALARKDKAAAKAYVDRVVERNPRNAEVLIFKGDFERGNGNNAGALEAYRRVTKLDPGNAAGHVQSAYVLVAERRFDEAKQELAVAKKIAPKNLNVAYVGALVYFSQKKFPEALEALQQVLRAQPDHWPSVLLAGAVQFSLNSMPQAEQHLKHYLAQFPDSDYARKLLASTQLAAGNPKAALATVQPKVADSTDTQLLDLAGKAYMDNHEYANAAATFERASKLEPTKAPLRTSLGLSKLQEGDHARAMTELELAASLDLGSTDASMTLAVTALRVGQYDKALAALRQIDKRRPNDATVLNLTGLALLGKQDRPGARASFERALSIRPDFFPAVDSLARMDLEDKKLNLTRQRYEAFVNNYPSNVEALTALGALSVAQGQPALATPLLERASAVNPAAVDPAVFLATHYRAIGESAKALSLIRKLQIVNPENPLVLDQLGQLQLASGDSGGAMESFNRLVMAAPTSVPAFLRLAQAHVALNNLPSAAAAYKRALSLQPDFLDAQLALAAIYLRQGLPGEALPLVRQIQKQHPKLPVGFVSEGDILMLQRMPAAALPLYDKAFSLGKNAELLLKLVVCLNANGKGKAADAKVAQWRASHPADVKVPAFLAAQYLANKNYQLAIAEYEAILKQHPQHLVALNNLATAYEEIKDPRALPTAQLAYKADPQSPEVLDTLGTMLAERGELQKGVGLLRTAVAKVPGRADIRYHLLRALVKSKDLEGARKEFDILAAKHADFPRLKEARALLKQ